MPTENTSACWMLARKASTVCPDKVRPALSLTVKDTISGTLLPFFSITVSAAYRAAFTLRVSNTVSMMSASTPPSSSASICTAYDATISSKVTARIAGLLTSGEMLRVLFVGPTSPSTKRGLSGLAAVYSSATLRAI